MDRVYNFEQSIGMLSMQVSRGVGKYLKREFEKNDIKVEPLEWSVIAFLNAKPHRSQNEIADFLWINKVMVNRILGALEQKGLIMRFTDKDDKRFKVVDLTDKGLELYKKASKSAAIAIAQVCKSLSETEFNTLQDLLIRVKSNLTI
jgi:DNA-binding MarR family transcriptional regulator